MIGAATALEPEDKNKDTGSPIRSGMTEKDEDKNNDAGCPIEPGMTEGDDEKCQRLS